MADGDVGRSEKKGLGKCVQSQTKYGTSGIIQPHPVDSQPELYLRHVVQSSDTINSIALKYGVTTNDIRTTNNIWSDNQIFILDCLYIPLSRADPKIHDSIQPTDSNVITHEKLLALRQKVSKSASHHARLADYASAEPKQNGIAQANVTCDRTAEVLSKDYFMKFDSSLAKIKENLTTLEKNSVFNGTTESRLFVRSPRWDAYGRGSRSWTVDMESLDPAREPQMRFISHSSCDPAIRQTLEHLERTQEEMFQL